MDWRMKGRRYRHWGVEHNGTVVKYRVEGDTEYTYILGKVYDNGEIERHGQLVGRFENGYAYDYKYNTTVYVGTDFPAERMALSLFFGESRGKIDGFNGFRESEGE